MIMIMMRAKLAIYAPFGRCARRAWILTAPKAGASG